MDRLRTEALVHVIRYAPLPAFSYRRQRNVTRHCRIFCYIPVLEISLFMIYGDVTSHVIRETSFLGNRLRAY